MASFGGACAEDAVSCGVSLWRGLAVWVSGLRRASLLRARARMHEAKRGEPSPKRLFSVADARI